MFSGVFVAIITPFINNKIDEDSLRKHAGWLVENGVHGLVPCGTTGEGATLTHQEYSQIVKAVKEETGGSVPIIAGAGANATAKACELARLVEEAGADATLQVTPYYNKPTQEGLYQHFKAIAETTKIPHILYNVPGRTAVNMLPETVERLSKIENIAGIKEASGNLEQIEQIRRVVPDNFSILCGNDDQNVEVYIRGGNGAISVTANVSPKEVSTIFDLDLGGKSAEAKERQHRLHKLNESMFIETNPIPVKTSLFLMGRCHEEFRLPLTQMVPVNKEKLKIILKSYNLI